MNDDLDPPLPGAPSPPNPSPPPAASATVPTRLTVRSTTRADVRAARAHLWLIGLAALTAVSVASLVLAWKADQRGASLEQELVQRQQESAAQATEARMLAKQSQENVTEATAKVALLEARVAEVAVQRTQLEDLIQSLSRSRDENLLVDVEAAIRVGLQQTAITGSAEPLVAALKQTDERLARQPEPRLEGVRRAIARDLGRIQSTGVADISSLGIKLDEAIRLADELPLTAAADARRDDAAGTARAAQAAGRPASAAASANTETGTLRGWTAQLSQAWDTVGERVWNEAKSLVRVTRIDHPDAMLIAPEQAFFLRENLKLRLLNARLALMSRQFDVAQSDLQVALLALERYFDRSAKRTQLAAELVRQVSGQARRVGVPRPDDTLAALATAQAVR